MGGRIALRYAANFPHKVFKLLIEDISTEAFTLNIAPPDFARLSRFNRRFETWDDCVETLVNFGYERERIEKYRGHRIVEEANGTFWSALHPYSRYLAFTNVLATSDAKEALKSISKLRPPIETHLWVAGHDSACSEEGEQKMRDILPILTVRKFETAGHSIHRDEENSFVCGLMRLLDADMNLREFVPPQKRQRSHEGM
eukprot:c3434_g1_i2.p1 GENE.c3434_g1_i2~~c3434_g1_i2.p1  ORF type:complete len:200 (+),score=46.27 c3434_g1_i2:361-960(+)